MCANKKVNWKIWFIFICIPEWMLNCPRGLIHPQKPLSPPQKLYPVSFCTLCNLQYGSSCFPSYSTFSALMMVTFAAVCPKSSHARPSSATSVLKAFCTLCILQFGLIHSEIKTSKGLLETSLFVSNEIFCYLWDFLLGCTRFIANKFCICGRPDAF